MLPELEIQIIAVIASISCAVLGSFIVLRKMAMLTDAITHTILLGIVIAFFITQDLSSPLLYLGAMFMGLITVYLIELLQGTKLLSEESAIGVVFPFLFSIAIILISKYAGSVHLDTDSVLLGELAFAPFDRMIIFGIDIGAKSIYTMGAVLIINLLFIKIFYKELQLSSFDKLLAYSLGFAPMLLHYLLMSLVSLTAVSAFSAVGSILVVAFMIGPPITARLLTHNLGRMIRYSAGIAAFNALAGYQLARLFDVSIAGSMALITGLVFIAVLAFARENGLIVSWIRQFNLRKEFDDMTLLVHLYHHRNSDEIAEETGLDTIAHHLNWSNERLQKCIRRLHRAKDVQILQGQYRLTSKGAQTTLSHYQELFK